MDSPERSRRRDAALREAVLAQPDIGVAICNEEGVLVAVNEAMQSMLCAGYKRTFAEAWSEQYGLHDSTGTTPLKPFEDPLGRAVRGEVVLGQLVSVHTDDGLRVLQCRAHQLEEQGEVLGGVVFASDVTAEMARHRRLIALREKLIQTVNHELRTPLAAARGHLELLQDGQEVLPGDVQWSVDGVSRGLERLQAVVESLREVTDEDQLDQQRLHR